MSWWAAEAGGSGAAIPVQADGPPLWYGLPVCPRPIMKEDTYKYLLWNSHWCSSIQNQHFYDILF